MQASHIALTIYMHTIQNIMVKSTIQFLKMKKGFLSTSEGKTNLLLRG